MGAGEALIGSLSPAALLGALVAAHQSGAVANVQRFIVLEQRAVLLGFHDAAPVDRLGEAQLLVLQDGHASGADRAQTA